jgi:hypothetical protein
MIYNLKKFNLNEEFMHITEEDLDGGKSILTFNMN